MASLREKTNSALSWSALERALNQGLNFIIQILLARLIDPTEIGLLALLTVFVLFSNLILENGLGQAIIQKKDVTRADISTVFIFNLAGGIILYLILFASAPAVAQFYQEPRLSLLLRVVSLSIVINALGKIHNNLLVRNLEFKKLFRITTPALAIGGTVGVTMAVLGFEVWSIVAFQLITVTISTICYWLFSNQDCRPRREFSLRSFKELWKFGAGIFAASLMFHGVQNVYSLIIGKAFSFEQLGFYDRARIFHRTPMTFLSTVFNRVLFPVFATIQDNNAKIVSALRDGIPAISFIVFPLMALLMCNSDETVLLLLTDRWLPAARFVRWFPLVGMAAPLSAVLLSVLRGKGRSGLFFLLSLLKNAVAIGLLIYTVQFGVFAVVIGQVVAAIFGLFTNNVACHYVVNYRFLDQMADILPYAFVTALAAGVCIFAAQMLPVDSSLLMLIWKSVVFLTVYLGVSLLCGLGGLQTVWLRVRTLIEAMNGRRKMA